MELLFSMKENIILVLTIGFFYIAVTTSWDRFFRLRSLSVNGIGFFLLAFGTGLHLLRFQNPQYSLLIIGISSLLNTSGLACIWIHFQLMHQDSIDMVIFTLIISLLTMSFTMLLVHTLWAPLSILINGVLILTTINALFSLAMPIMMGLRDFYCHGNRQAALESASLICILGAVIAFSVHYFFGEEEMISSLLARVLLTTGSGGLIALYTWYPQVMYRVPFKIWYLLGFHDSGLFFYRKEIQQPYLHQKRITTNKRMHFLSGLFTAIDALFKHILDQDVIYTVQRSPNVEILFQRDPNRRIGYIIIAERHSHYLKQALETLLKLTPLKEMMLDPSPEREKDGQFPETRNTLNFDAFLIDQERVDQVITPLVEKIFPSI